MLAPSPVERMTEIAGNATLLRPLRFKIRSLRKQFSRTRGLLPCFFSCRMSLDFGLLCALTLL